MLAGLVAGRWITPLKREFLTPLDEGMAMDMPITVPRMSSTQAADDLQARDMILCRFPEVEMVVGKAGRAETATDPAPLDMIETMIAFRPREFWPRRCLRPEDTERQAAAVLDALAAAEIIRDPGDAAARRELANRVAMEAVPLFDAQMREAAYQRNKEFERDLGHRQARYAVARLIDWLERAELLLPASRPAGSLTRSTRSSPPTPPTWHGADTGGGGRDHPRCPSQADRARRDPAGDQPRRHFDRGSRRV